LSDYPASPKYSKRYLPLFLQR